MESFIKSFDNLIAGLFPKDTNIELFGNLKNRKVHFLQEGKVKKFKDLPFNLRRQLERDLLKDKQAMRDLSGLTWSESLEEYAFCLFGGLDSIPDFLKDGTLNATDNFRCGEKCKCLKWSTKKIQYQGVQLTIREIQIIDELKTGNPDKQIADTLNIAVSTLDTHKKNIMNKLNAQNKAQIIFNASTEGII